MQERERGVVTGLIVLLLILWLGFLVHRSPRFAGSLTGSVLGIAGAVLMVSAGAYALVKRSDRVKRAVTHKVSMRTLLTWHVYTGILGAILGLLHTGHKFQSTLGIALTATMLIVVFTGYFGRYLLNQVSQEIREKREMLSKLQIEYDAATLELGRHPEPALAFAATGMLARVFSGFFLQRAPAANGGSVTAGRAIRLAESIADLEYSIKAHDAIKATFGRWLKVHIAFSVLLYILLALHVWSGIRYGLRWFDQ